MSAAFNGRTSGRMTGPNTTQSFVRYSHKPVSNNVHRLQDGLNRYLDREEKEDLVTALNDYQSRRNVVDFVYNLKLILNTSEKRQAILPLLRNILPTSDLDAFDHCIQSKQRYGTTPRGARGASRHTQHSRGMSTLPSSTKRSVKSVKSETVNLKSKNSGLSPKSVKSTGINSRTSRNKTMIRGNDIFRVQVPPPPTNEGFGFSIRGGCDFGIGIYVSFVGERGLAKEQGLDAGDLVLEVNDISFRKISHEDAAKIIRSARKLDLVVCRVGRIPGSYSVHQSYIWMDPDGRHVAPPPELEQIGQAKSGEQRRSGLMLLNAADERKINIVVEDDASLGLMIRGGREFGLGIYITGVDRNSVSQRAGLKVGDQILDINGQSFLDISHSEAVEILTDGTHMMMTIKDVGKIPYAKTTVDKTLWLSSDQVRRSHSNKELSNSYREANGDAEKTAFLRGAGSQLMLNSMATQQWDMIQERARQLLNVSEQDTLRLHVDDYQRRFIKVEELVVSLNDLLNTSAKFSLMPEVRNLIYPKDLDKYDALVMKREVEMIKSRQKYLAQDSPSSLDSYDVNYSPGAKNKSYATENVSRHRHNSSPDSSPEFSKERRRQDKYNINDGNRSQIYSSTGNITLVKKPPRHKLNAHSSDRLYATNPGMDWSNNDATRGQKSRSNFELRKARSEDQLLVMADVHDGLFSAAKPVEEVKNPAEGDSGVYMNGSSGSDSSSPSSGHTESGQTFEKNQIQNLPLDSSSSNSPLHRSSGPFKMTEKGDNFVDVWREKYGDITFEPITIYKTKPTLGLAIEGGANTRQPLPRVISVQPGGSAYESSGIKVGHVLLEVNGRCLVGMEHKDAARAIAEAFKNKSLDRMEMLVTETSTDVKAVLEHCKKS